MLDQIKSSQKQAEIFLCVQFALNYANVIKERKGPKLHQQ